MYFIGSLLLAGELDDSQTNGEGADGHPDRYAPSYLATSQSLTAPCQQRSSHSRVAA